MVNQINFLDYGLWLQDTAELNVSDKITLSKRYTWLENSLDFVQIINSVRVLVLVQNLSWMEFVAYQIRGMRSECSGILLKLEIIPSKMGESHSLNILICFSFSLFQKSRTYFLITLHFHSFLLLLDTQSLPNLTSYLIDVFLLWT